MLQVPGLDHGAVDGDNTGGRKGLAHQLPFPLQQLHQHDAAGGIVEGGSDLQGGNLRGGDIQVFDIAFFSYIQPNLPVQSAVGQIVHDKTKGRHVTIFCGVQLHSQQVLPAGNGCTGDLHPEAGIAAAVGRQLLTVQVNNSNVGSAVKLQEYVLSRQFFAQLQLPPVAADHLIGIMIRVVLRAVLHIMGQPDSSPLPFSLRKAVEPVGDEFPVVAKTQHSKASLFLFSIL